MRDESKRTPERLRRLAVLQAEWQRTVMHLYPSVEEASLPRATAAQAR